MAGIKNILSMISGAFNTPQQPITPLPAPLLLTGANMRTGLSANNIMSNVISRAGSIGINTGDNIDGQPNVEMNMLTILVEEIIQEILINGKVEIIVNAGVPISGVGGNAAGPVVIQGVTVSFGMGSGVIR